MQQCAYVHMQLCAGAAVCRCSAEYESCFQCVEYDAGKLWYIASRGHFSVLLSDTIQYLELDVVAVMQQGAQQANSREGLTKQHAGAGSAARSTACTSANPV